MTSTETKRTELLPIGAVVERTGIQDTTLRIWERRYGVPRPVRLASGHRRYTRDQVIFLRFVAEALALGLRAGNVLLRSREELERLLNERRAVPKGLPRDWEILVRAMDRGSLESALAAARQRLGLTSFLDDCAGSMLTRVASSRADGSLEIHHESFVSELVVGFLRDACEKDAARGGPSHGKVLIGTFPGGRHPFGTQSLACIASSLSVGHELLDGNMPLEAVATAARERRADAVAVSISRGAVSAASLSAVNELRRLLPPRCLLGVAGDGARRFRRSPPRVQLLPSNAEALRWLTTIREQARS